MSNRPQLRLREHEFSTQPFPINNIAAVYDKAGDDYLAYADGDASDLFSFDGLHAYADKRLWSILESQLNVLKSAGVEEIHILDAGCGPGTWLRRVVSRARQLGFSRITARGFDVSEAQIKSARRLAADLSNLPGVSLAFDVGDVTGRLPEADASVDITLCLYSVLSHLPAPSLPQVAAELARVTRGSFVSTVRSVGSTPTIFIDSADKARQFKLDHRRDRYDIDLNDGRHLSVRFHLFTAAEFRGLFAGHFTIEDLRGLDIFHTRFMPDARWNPKSIENDPRLTQSLAQLEETCATNPAFLDRATHLLLVGSRHACDSVVPLRQPTPSRDICDTASV